MTQSVDPTDLLAALRRAWDSYPPEPNLREIIPAAALTDDEIVNALLFVDVPERVQRGLPATLAYYLTLLPELQSGSKAVQGILLSELTQREDRLDPEVATRLERLYGERFAPDVHRVIGMYRDFQVEDAEKEAPSVFRPGTRLDKYGLVRFIDRGSYGEVWKARDLELERYVALKLIQPIGPDIPEGEVPDVLLAEARAAASIHHPNVVNVHRAGRLEGGWLFLDTQLCGDPDPTEQDRHEVAVGESLAMLGIDDENRPFYSPHEAARLIAAAARGVAAAHARDVVHRDIKPWNILLTPFSETPMVADFGLAAERFVQSSTAEAVIEDAGHTIVTELRDGRRIVGTPTYMAPEQARGEHATTASDVYALGATLFFLLTGKHPYEPTSGHDSIRDPGGHRDIVRQVAAPDSPPASIPALLPLNLRRIWAKAVHEPDERYETAEDLALDLDAWADGRVAPIIGPSSWHEPARLWCRRNPWLVIAIVLGVLMSLAASAITGGIVGSAAKARTLAGQAMSLAVPSEFGPLAPQVSMLESLADEIERVYGSDDLARADLERRVAFALWWYGRQADSIEHYRTAYEIYERRLGPGVNETLGLAMDLAGLIYHLGRLNEAREIISEARNMITPGDPKTLHLVAMLDAMSGIVLSLEGSHDAAIDQLTRVSAERMESSGIGDATAKRMREYLAEAYAECGRFAEAEPILAEVVRVARAENRDRGDAFSIVEEWEHGLGLIEIGLAEIAIADGEADEADDWLKQANDHLTAAYDGRRRWLGKENPETLRTLDALARLAAARGDAADARGDKDAARVAWEDAKQKWTRVLDAERKLLGKTADDEAAAATEPDKTKVTGPMAANAFYMADTRRVYGRFLVDRGELDRAELLLDEALIVQLATGGEASARTADTKEALADLEAAR